MAVLVFAQVLILQSLAATPVSGMQVTVAHGGIVNIGENYQFQSVDLQVSLENNTSNPVVLKKIEPISEHDKVLAYPKRLAPGESGKVRLVVWTWLDLWHSPARIQD